MNLVDYGFVRKITKEITADYNDFHPNKQYDEKGKLQYKQDVSFGLKNEKNIKTIIEHIVKQPINKYYNKYSTFDYYIGDTSNPKMNIEVKSRRNDIMAYPTQLIGCNKIDKGRKLKEKNEYYDTLLIFKLTDGIYYWFDDGRELQKVMRGNFARGQKPCELYLIPNELLTLIKPLSP